MIFSEHNGLLNLIPVVLMGAERAPGSPAQKFLCVYRYLRSEFFPARFHTRTSCYPGLFLFEALFSHCFFVGEKFSFSYLCLRIASSRAYITHHIFTCSFSFLVRCTFRIYFYYFPASKIHLQQFSLFTFPGIHYNNIYIL